MSSHKEIKILVSLLVALLIINSVECQYIKAFQRKISMEDIDRKIEIHSDHPLTLEDSIALALQNVRQIRIARLNVGIAEDRIITARSFLLPKIKASASNIWLDKQPGMYNPDTEVSFIAGEKEAFRSEARLLVPIYDFGRSFSRYKEMKLYKLSQESVVERTRQEVVFEVTEAYFNILMAERLKQVAQEAVRLNRAHLKQAKDFFAEGLVDKKDVLQAEVRLAQAEQRLFKTENDYEMAVSTFNKIIGVDIDFSTHVIDLLSSRPFTSDLKTCITLADQSRPELFQLRKHYEMARAAVDAAKAERYPRIYGTGGFKYDNDEYRLNDKEWSASLNMEISLFSGGGLTAQINEAKKKFQQAKEAYDDLITGLRLQVKGAYLAVVEAKKRLSVTEKAISQAEENLRILENQYMENIVPSTDVLDAQTLFVRAKADHYQALYYVNTAIACLEWAMGAKLSE